MALRIPTKTTDHITVISPIDSSIDHTCEKADALIEDYIQAEAPDYSELPLVEGDPPTKFVIRPLSERELSIVHEMGKRHAISAGDSGDDLFFDFNAMAVHYQMLRFALVEVIDGPDFVGKKERLYSSTVWTLESVSAIDMLTAQFLGTVVLRWSSMQKKTQ